MLESLVWILAGITAWCVASLALALTVGPLVRRRREDADVVRPVPARPLAAPRLAAPMQLQR
ncbi:MAG TPA: hypothetical protein VIG76_10160 [Amnibacterium sp.]|jgi:hypothetical protein|uniref:hypothetical protein n=1 Tax=Amnibacterium sp. TaxID=1872496 RepID=UPI002F956605